MTARTASAREASDWLSPILVKDLRQGLRSTTFVAAFVLIHVLMVASLLLASPELLARSSSAASATFWSIVGTWMLLVMPGRVFAELRREFHDRSIELVLLSRLTAWRIVAGRWASVFLQTLLVTSAVLPYAVLRYFLGGVDLIGDLDLLGYLLVASAVVTGLVLVAAAFQSRLLNGGLVMAMVWLFPWVARLAASSASPTLAGMTAPALATSALAGGLALLVLLEIAASRIAPPAENHALRKRGGALLLVAFAVLTGRPSLWTGLTGVLLLFVCMDAVCEEPTTIAAVYRPFAQRGGLVRLMGWLFYPGWASGLLFAIVAEGVLNLEWSVLAALPALLLLPLVLMPATRARRAWYAGIQLGLWVMAGSLARVVDVRCLVPIFTVVARWVPSSHPACVGPNLFLSAASIALVLMRDRGHLVTIQEGEQRARSSLPSPVTPAA